MSNDPLDNSDGGLSAEVAVLDRTNPELDYGRARTDRRHIFNAALVWMLPTLEDKSSAMRSVFGDWEVAGIVGAASGQPLTVHTGSILGLSGGPSGTGYTDNQRPNQVVGQPCHPSGGLPEQILNPAAYTHTSVAIADALKAVALPAVEVHLSNVHAREPYRHQSFVAPVCVGTIGGFGARGYALALDAVLDLLEEKTKS